MSANGSVLIVDDNADLVSALKAVLARFDVTTASNGAQARKIAAEEGFDVAIVDVKLPDASGVDLIEPLRRSTPFSEVVLITGFASVDAAIGALRSGAFAFVLKSFRPEELISTVEQALAKVRLQRERDELERRHRALIDLTDVLVVGVDAKDKVGLFNPRASAVTKVAVDQALGKPFFEWIPPEDQGRVRDALAHARLSGAREVETGFTDARRRVRWHLSCNPEEGGEGMVYGIGIDVTERRALEKRAADAEALSAMGTLAMNLAHEIRNPLNAAVLQLNLLRRQVDKLEAASTDVRAALHKRAEIVGDEIGRLNRLLTEFLELARPRGIAREPVHVASLVADVLDLEIDSAKERGITIQRELAADGCVAIGDREKLKQVIINLVVNAIEAMKNGGTLTVHVACPGDRVSIVFEDTGPGIEPQDIGNVFDPFFTTKEAGTGLGLTIVRKIVDQHAGEVHLDSARGKGTRVEVTIPTGRSQN
jgi:two-component system, cell cycle sensor histidine kinase and response regulator CckA